MVTEMPFSEGAAMSVIYFGASLPTAEWPIALVVVDGAVTAIVAGLVIGAVTGAGLIKLLRDATDFN